MRKFDDMRENSIADRGTITKAEKLTLVTAKFSLAALDMAWRVNKFGGLTLKSTTTEGEEFVLTILDDGQSIRLNFRGEETYTSDGRAEGILRSQFEKQTRVATIL